MKTMIFLLAIILLAIVHFSCRRMAPAGFWENYNPTLIQKNISDLGPNGGHQTLYWKAAKMGTFNPASVIEYAIKNSWRLVDSSKFSTDQTDKWVYNNIRIFPLTSKGFSDTIFNDAILAAFPRWFGGQIKVYKFKTGWTAFEPGTSNTNEENGFVILNNDGTEMSVYHLWGD